MNAEQIVILVLLVAAFASGWFAGGGRERRGLPPGEEEEDVAPVDAPVLEAPAAPEAAAGLAEPPLPEERHARAPGAVPMPPGWPVPAAAPVGSAAAGEGTAPPASEPVAAPVAGVGRAIDRAVAALEGAVDRWLDEGEEISPAGRATLGELDRALGRLDAAIARLGDERPDGPEARIAAGALDALREAAELLAGFREGRRLDAGTNRELSLLEDEVADARQRLEAGAPQ